MDLQQIPVTPPPCHFPSDVLRWMKANSPNPRITLKLMQICKYFQSESFLTYFPVKAIENSSVDNIGYKMLDDSCRCVNGVDKIPNKLWIIYRLQFFNANIISQLVPKIGFCEAKMLSFVNINVFFTEFQILNAGKYLEILYMENATLKYENDIVVPFEIILASLPKIECLIFKSVIPPIKSLQPAKDATSSTLTNVIIDRIPKDYNICTFLEYMDNNPRISFKVLLHDTHNIKELQAYAKKVVKKGLTEFPPPLIYLYQKSHKSQMPLLKLHEKFHAKQNKNLINDLSFDFGGLN